MKKSKINRLKKKDKKSQRNLNRGVVLIRHIPHGFYEEQLKAFFSQFGEVTRTRVSRSQKTGNARGYAFVEFQVPEVAKIASEAMNNYLMFKKRLETKYIAPEEQHQNLFFTSLKKVNDDGEIKVHSGKTKKTEEYVARYNAELTNEQLQKRINRTKSNINQLKLKFSEAGVEFDPIILNKIIRSDKVSDKNVKQKPTAKPKGNLSDLMQNSFKDEDDDSSDDDFEVDLDDSNIAMDDDENSSAEEESDGSDVDLEEESLDDEEDDDDDDEDDDDEDDEDEDDEDDDDEDDDDSNVAASPPSPPKRKASTDLNFKKLLEKKEINVIKKAKLNNRKNSVPDKETLQKLKGLIEKNSDQVKQVKGNFKGKKQHFGKKK